MTEAEVFTGILPCIACGKICESAVPDSVGSVNQPHRATVFTTTGQYGSTFWDCPSGSLFIEINVCDDCLQNNEDRILVGLEYRKTETEYTLYTESRLR